MPVVRDRNLIICPVQSDHQSNIRVPWSCSIGEPTDGLGLTSSSAFTRRNPERWEFQVCSPSIDYHTFRARGVPQHRCSGLLAVPPRRYPYLRPCRASRCCFCHGDAGRRQQSRGYRCARFEQSARTHPSKICVHRLPFRILPRYVGGQAVVRKSSIFVIMKEWNSFERPPKDGSESAPFRPIPILV